MNQHGAGLEARSAAEEALLSACARPAQSAQKPQWWPWKAKGAHFTHSRFLEFKGPKILAHVQKRLPNCKRVQRLIF